MAPTGWISPKKYKHRVLRNIKVDEVSSVDRGAGHGVRVMLTKGDPVRKWDGKGQLGDRGYRYVENVEKGNNQMSQLQQIGKALEARARGEVSDIDLAKQHQALAVDAFPQCRSIGEALAKWYGTAPGQAALTGAQHYKSYELQKRSQCGDAWDVQMRKGDPGPSGPKEHATSDPDGVEEPYSKKHARLVNAGFSADESHTMLHRMEKQRRGIG
jgi:hypothetical protein